MIEILMATYNGEKYLSAQIDSILRQTFKEWSLLIHDDGSSDQTSHIICEYQKKHPEKIKFINDGISGLGAKNNFIHLMERCTANYIMFCDQDDIWFENKVEQSFKLLREKEGIQTCKSPIGVFTDVKIVDKLENPISNSLWKHLDVSPYLVESIKKLAIRNCVVGCTMVINRSALKVSLPIPEEAVMHDWWIGLSILKNNGVLVPLKNVTLLYRQHNSNTVGAEQFSILRHVIDAFSIMDFIRSQEQIFRMAKRAGIIQNRFDFYLIKIRVLVELLLRRRGIQI